jgi:hypothetical protein
VSRARLLNGIPAALAIAALLTAAGLVATTASGASGTAAVAEAAASGSGPSGCPGCCARDAAVDERPRCQRRAEGGCCGPMNGPAGGWNGRGPGAGGGWRGGGPAVMQTARALVHDYRHLIERQVEEIEGGVVAVTRSPSSPQAAAAIRRHVLEMKGLLESGGRVRVWDPLFRELLERGDQISMEIEELADGMRVTETSADPQVVELLRTHARKVTEFIERGPAAVHEPTPLPAGWDAAE